MKKQRRDYGLHVRLTEAERRLIEDMALTCGDNLSYAARRALLAGAAHYHPQATQVTQATQAEKVTG